MRWVCSSHQGLRVEVGIVLPLSLVLWRSLVLQHRIRVDAPKIHDLRSVTLPVAG